MLNCNHFLFYCLQGILTCMIRIYCFQCFSLIGKVTAGLLHKISEMSIKPNAHGRGYDKQKLHIIACSSLPMPLINSAHNKNVSKINYYAFHNLTLFRGGGQKRLRSTFSSNYCRKAAINYSFNGL